MKKMGVKRVWFIYTLTCPATNRIRYIGVTVNVASRLSGHMSLARRKGKKTHCAAWIYSLLKRGVRPQIKVVEQGMGNKWQSAERKWIKYFKDLGEPITNHTDGGDHWHRGKKGRRGKKGLFPNKKKLVRKENLMRLNHYLPPKLARQLANYAKEGGWSKAEIVRRAIASYLFQVGRGR